MSDENKSIQNQDTEAQQTAELSENVLERVVGGDKSTTGTMQMIAYALKMIQDTTANTIRNIRS